MSVATAFAVHSSKQWPERQQEGFRVSGKEFIGSRRVPRQGVMPDADRS